MSALGGGQLKQEMRLEGRATYSMLFSRYEHVPDSPGEPEAGVRDPIKRPNDRLGSGAVVPEPFEE
jgi:hypothetical protein